MRVEVVAHRAHDRVAQRQRVAHALAPQVEHAVAQAQRLVDLDVVVERERRRLGLGEPLGLGRPTARSPPCGSFGLTVPSSRRTTSPATLITCSERSRCASACASGESSGWKTTWRMPERSRRSMNTRPPRSRRRCTQPATRTLLADARGVQLAGPRVAVGVGARRSHSPRPMWCITVLVSTSRCSPVSMSFSAVPSSPRIATYRAPVRSACLSWPLRLRPPSSSRAAWPARRASAASRNASARWARAGVGDVEVDRRRRGRLLRRGEQDPLDARRPSPCRACAGRRSPRSARRSARRRRRPTARRARRT